MTLTFGRFLIDLLIFRPGVNDNPIQPGAAHCHHRLRSTGGVTSPILSHLTLVLTHIPLSQTWQGP
jgi:hypothetical protein